MESEKKGGDDEGEGGEDNNAPTKQTPADHSWQSGGVDFDDDDNGDTTTNHDDDNQDGDPSVLATLGTKATGHHGE